MLLLFTIVASPCRDLFAAVGAGAGDDELNTSAVSTVAAGFMTSLAVVNRIGVDVVFRAFARRVATLSPLIDRIKARAVVGAAVFIALLFQFADVRMCFRSLAMVPVNAAIIRCRLVVIADDQTVFFRFGFGFGLDGLGDRCSGFFRLWWIGCFGGRRSFCFSWFHNCGFRFFGWLLRFDDRCCICNKRFTYDAFGKISARFCSGREKHEQNRKSNTTG